MAYKRADRSGWRRVRTRFVCQRIGGTQVNGYATLLQMVEITEPLWVMHHDQRICIADVGHAWLQIFPEGANYTHTTMFDAEGKPVQEYIDIVASQGIGNDGIPWYDDLYLDIAWIPEGTPLLLDQEELEAAHAIEAITQEQYDLARGEAARLLVALTLGDYTLPELTRIYYPVLRAALDAAAATGASEAATAAVASEAEATKTPEATTSDGTDTPDAEAATTAEETTELPAAETAEAVAAQMMETSARTDNHEEHTEHHDHHEPSNHDEHTEQPVEDEEQHA